MTAHARGAVLRSLLMTCLVLIVDGCAYIDLKQREFIFRPTQEIAGTPADFGFEFEEVWLPVMDAALTGARTERMHAWWIPSPVINAPAILYLHGNGWNIGDSAYDTARLRRMGFSVLAVDYRGYGKSEGAFPSEVQVYADAQAAWNHLATLKPHPGRRFVYGHSLGSAVAIELAVRNPDITGLIVHAGFTSASVHAAPVALSRTIAIRLRTFHLLQKPQVRLGQAVGKRSLTEQRDVADRRIAVTLIAVSHVSHGAHRSAVLVLYLEP